MKSYLRSLSAGVALCALALISLASPAFAVGGTVNIKDSFPPNIVPQCYAVATSTAIATTVATDVAGLTCAFVPTHYDPTTAARPRADLIKVSYSLQALKSTATTGTCSAYANAAIVADTSRLVGYATPTVTGHTFTLSGTFIIPNTTVGNQTVKVQCVSADTNTLTVSSGYLYVEELVRQ